MFHLRFSPDAIEKCAETNQRMRSVVDVQTPNLYIDSANLCRDNAPLLVSIENPPMVDKRFTVLISEDEVDINNLLALILQSEDFNVYQAFDGMEAYELFAAHTDEIDLLVTDLGLPKMGGVELIEKARRMKPSVKIIGASGFGRNNVREEVMLAGGDEFMPKPYVTSELLDLAKKLLSVV